MPLIRVLFFVCLTVVAANCGGGSSRDNEDESGGPERRGTPVQLTEKKYYDGMPSLSTDGSKVVFLSGRNDKLQAFYKDLDAEDAPRRVLGDDVDQGEELETVISPTGTFAAISSFQDATMKVLVRDLASQGEPTEVESGTNFLGRLSVSPDGVFLAYEASGESGQRFLKVAQINGDFTAEEPSQLGSGDTKLYEPVWISGGPNYSLVAFQANVETGRFDIVKADFTAGADLSSLTLSTVASDIDAVDRKLLTGSTANMVYASYYEVADRKERLTIGDDESTETFIVEYDPVLTTIAGASETVETTGFSIRDLSLNGDGTVAAFLSLERLDCKDKDVRFATSFKIYDVANKSFEQIFPIAKEDLSDWRFSDNMCETEFESDVAGFPDFNPFQVQLNGAATLSAFTAVFETAFSKNENEFGDREVRVLKKDGDGYSIVDVSSNPKP